MPNELDDIFKRLRPPPNGLAELRSRIERQRAGRRRRRLAWALAGAGAILLALVLRVPPVTRWSPDGAETTTSVGASLGPAAFPTLATLGLLALPNEPVTLPQSEQGSVAVHRVATDNPDVVFYLVGTTRQHSLDGT